MPPRQRLFTPLTHSAELKVPTKARRITRCAAAPTPLTHTNHFWGSQLGPFSSTCEKRGGPRDLDRYINMLQSSPHQYTPHSHQPETRRIIRATCSSEVNDRQTEQQQHKTPLTHPQNPKPHSTQLINLHPLHHSHKLWQPLQFPSSTRIAPALSHESAADLKASSSSVHAYTTCDYHVCSR